MSFGFGVGDIISVVTITKEVLKALRTTKGAVSQFHEVKAELEALQSGLDNLFGAEPRSQTLTSSPSHSQLSRAFKNGGRTFSSTSQLKRLVSDLRSSVQSGTGDRALDRLLNALLSLFRKILTIPWRLRLGILPCVSSCVARFRFTKGIEGRLSNIVLVSKQLLRGDATSPRLLNLAPVLGPLLETRPIEFSWMY